jgi:hypothetical protein
MLADELLAEARAAAREEAAHVAAVTDWGVVTVASPLEVRISGDTDGQPVSAAAGVTPALGDTVGLVRFGRRWYVTHVLAVA